MVYALLIVVLLMPEQSMRSLKKYQKKRDFSKTAEPSGLKAKVVKRKKQEGIFVIQQHAARAMHYDVRLEIGNVLVSWAVPKGPSLNPAIKRLAVMTEDHPVEYAKFEGIIPPGEYGAGPVIIWDRGTYKNIRDESMKTCLRQGQIEVFFNGKKLHGSFSLVRTDPTTKEKSRWLLIKMDEYADARRNIVTSEPQSVKTGKTIKDLKKKMKNE
jgi:DNA ligase D-like protein (predicted 3'-phosphoesterase)